jgi:hypothetical protein
VLHTFDPSTLRPVGQPPTDREAAIRALLHDCEPATSTPGHFSLLSHARRRALAELGSRERLREALSANSPPSDDPVQRVLGGWIQGDLVPLEQLTTQELQSALRVSEWLGQTLADIPSRDEIREQLESRQAQDVLRRLAGDRFAGRARELDELREFAGMQPSRPPWLPIARLAREFGPSSHRPAPLAIYGPGGIGKSALVARLLVENLERPAESRLPYAYYDLGRSQFRTSDPVALVSEWLRQLRREYSVSSKAIDAAVAFLSSVKPTPETCVAALRSVFERLPLGGKLYLLVLDSVDEVQMAGSQTAQGFRALIEALPHAVPTLRVIVVGRVRFVPGSRPLQISELDPEAASAVLAAGGIGDEGLRLDLIKEVGGNPLALALGAQLIKQGEPVGALRDPLSHLIPLGSRTQGKLFARLIDHIADADVRKLARVAAGVRRVTADVIQHILAPAIGIDVREADADRLLDELANETTLFTPDEYRAIRMRADLRQTIFSFLRWDEPERTTAIHRRAVDYYAAQESLASRAEEIYHRLCTNEPAVTLDARWQPGIERYLYSAVDELSDEATAYLRKRLGAS